MASILIVEDDADIQRVLAWNLAQAGHDVATARSGEQGLSLARSGKPDLLVLDLMLPDLPGTNVCRALKADPATAGIRVLILTAKGDEQDRVVGFELGADDYVVKPFSLKELLLRVEAMLRRGLTQSPSGRVEFGVLGIDKEARRAWVKGQELQLTTLEFKLLCALQGRGNRVSTRDALLDEVWGEGAFVTSRTIDTHVQRLREKLGPGARYIETVRGEGYRFAEHPGGTGE